MRFGTFVVVAWTMIGLLVGFIAGMLVYQYILLNFVEDIAGTVNVENVEVGFNETYVMDRFDETVKDVAEEQNRSNYTNEERK